MANTKNSTGEYAIGKGKPPTEHQYPKGKSGNLKGRPKSNKSGSTDLIKFLEEPVTVKADGKECKMSPFEAGLMQLAKRAIGGHLPSIVKFIGICTEYGVIAPPPDDQDCRVIVAPKGVKFHEWLEIVTELVPDDQYYNEN